MASLTDPQTWLTFLTNVFRLAVWLVILSVIFPPLEWLFALRPGKFFRRGLLQDIGYYFISSLVPSLILAVPLSLVALGAHALVPYPVQSFIAALPFWQKVLIGVVVGEIGFYWGHRWTHEIPFLWRFHSIHHSPEHMYFLVSSRVHPIDSVFTRLCGLVPVYILGVATPTGAAGNAVPVALILVTTLWGFFIHSNIKWRLGPLEWLIATPGFHHWHHTRSGLRDRNYAPMFPGLDLLFGTYYAPAKQWPEDYGIDNKLPPTIMGQLAHPLRREPEQAAAAPNPVTAA